MNTSGKLLLRTLFLLSSPTPGWTSHAEDLDSLHAQMTDIVDRLTRMEAEMVMKDKLISEQFKMITGLRKEIGANDEADLQLRGVVNQVRTPPRAWKGGLTASNSVVTYDRLTFSSITVDGGNFQRN